jgi:hypothetical protein
MPSPVPVATPALASAPSESPPLRKPPALPLPPPLPLPWLGVPAPVEGVRCDNSGDRGVAGGTGESGRLDRERDICEVVAEEVEEAVGCLDVPCGAESVLFLVLAPAPASPLVLVVAEGQVAETTTSGLQTVAGAGAGAEQATSTSPSASRGAAPSPPVFEALVGACVQGDVAGAGAV